jgi:hypothetical protein
VKIKGAIARKIEEVAALKVVAERMPLIPDAHWKPYPELVADRRGPYEVVDSRRLPGAVSSGMTDKKERIVYSPHEEDGARSRSTSCCTSGTRPSASIVKRSA